MKRQHSFGPSHGQHTGQAGVVESTRPSTRPAWTCPDDRELAVLSRMHRGWSTHFVVSGPPAKDSLSQGAMLEVEWSAIRAALQKAEMFDSIEQRRVGLLVEQITHLKAACKVQKSWFACCFCGMTSFFPFSEPKLTNCIGCLKRVCTSCLVPVNLRRKKIVLLCRLCCKLTEIWKKSGAWYYKKLPDYVSIDRQTAERLTPIFLNLQLGKAHQEPAQYDNLEPEFSSSDLSDDNMTTYKRCSLKIIKSGEYAPRDTISSKELVVAGYEQQKRSNGLPGDRATCPQMSSSERQGRSSTLPGKLTVKTDVDHVHYHQLTPEPVSPSLPFTSPHLTFSMSPSTNGLQPSKELAPVTRSSGKQLQSAKSKQSPRKSPVLRRGQTKLVRQRTTLVESSPDEGIDEAGHGMLTSANMVQSSERQNEDNEGLGSVTFSVLYEGAKSRLVVTIIKCEDLKAMNFFSSSDPFVQVQLLPRLPEHSEFRTAVKKKTLNPKFNESFHFEDLQDKVDSLKLKLSVVDFNTLKANNSIGEVIFPLQDIHPNLPVTYVRNLQPCADKVNKNPTRRSPVSIRSALSLAKTDRGKLLVSLQFIHSETRLVVGIIRATGLPPVDSRTQSSDPYVKCYLHPGSLKKNKRRTAVHHHTLNPEFQEQFSYEIEWTNLSSHRLDISLWNFNVMTNNDFIGSVSFSVDQHGDAAQQWSNVLKMTDRTFTAWHELSPVRPPRRLTKAMSIQCPLASEQSPASSTSS